MYTGTETTYWQNIWFNAEASRCGLFTLRF